ncbi:holdfast attachment protein HfaA [soil metagenome]
MAPRTFCGLMVLSGLVLAMTATHPARAQTLSTNSASYNGGYGRVQGQENRPVEVSTKDANGNRLIVNGIIQTGASSFSAASAGAGASASASSGVGSIGGATAIGNNLTVVTQGNYNTVIVNSTQTNNGAVSAVTTIGGSSGH